MELEITSSLSTDFVKEDLYPYHMCSMTGGQSVESEVWAF